MWNKLLMACSTEIIVPLISVQFPMEKYVCHKKKKKALQFSVIDAFLASFWKPNRPWMDLDVLARPAQKWIKTVETLMVSCILAFGFVFSLPTHSGLHFHSKIRCTKLLFSVTSAWDSVYAESEVRETRFSLFPGSSLHCVVRKAKQILPPFTSRGQHLICLYETSCCGNH